MYYKLKELYYRMEILKEKRRVCVDVGITCKNSSRSLQQWTEKNWVDGIFVTNQLRTIAINDKLKCK